MLYFLKTDMRKQITPRLSKVRSDQLNNTIWTTEIGRQEQELSQLVVKSAKGELGVVEIDSKTNRVKNGFFLKLASHSQRISFSVYKDSAEEDCIQSELDSLIDNIVANLRNDKLVTKIGRSFSSTLINHLKGSFSDSYDDQLLEHNFKLEDLTLDDKGKPTLIQNVDVQRHPNDAGDQGMLESTESKRGELSRPVVGDQRVDTLNAERLIVKPENQEEALVEVDNNEYGIKKGSVKPEAYANYQRKLNELLNSVYLDDGTWKLNEESGSFKFWTQDHSHYVIQRAEIVLDHPLETVKAYVCDPDFRFKYDTLIKKFEVLETLSNQMILIHVVMKGKFPVSDRDFVSCRASFYHNKDVTLSHQTFVYMNFGPDFFEYPEQKGAVRAELCLQGIILTRLTDHSTRYTMYSKTDPKVKGVPQYFITQKAKESGRMPLAFKAKVDEFEAKKKSGQ